MLNVVISILLLLPTIGKPQIRTNSPSAKKPCSFYKQIFQADRDSGMVKVYEAGARDWSKTYARLMKAKYM